MTWPALQSTRMLEITRGGRLLPWLGPALRGMIAKPFKDWVCRHSAVERERDWVRCIGCPEMVGCPYGETFEPDPPQKVPFFKGQSDVPRPIVLAPLFPAPPRVQAGMLLPLQITLIGTQAIRHGNEVWQMINLEGRRSPGLGNDQIGFQLSSAREEEVECEHQIKLPTRMDSNDRIDRILVKLRSPLCLFTEEKPKHERVVQTRAGKRPRFLNTSPTFADLFRAAQRSLGGLFALQHGHRLDAEFDAMKQAALAVPTHAAEYEYFEQGRNSQRSGKWLARGVLGSAIFGPVPAELVPWVVWGGRLHVGTDRVAGAGAWVVEKFFSIV